MQPNSLATQTGLEPATFAVTGRRANQLRHWALLLLRAPNGIRTRATALKGRGPRPLDDGDLVPPAALGPPSSQALHAVRWKHRKHRARMPATPKRGVDKPLTCNSHRASRRPHHSSVTRPGRTNR